MKVCCRKAAKAILEEIEKGKFYSEEHECFAIPREEWEELKKKRCGKEAKR